MSVRSMPLRKILQLMYADSSLRTKKLRDDIRNELGRERGDRVGGPDFYSPFWRSAKDHVFGLVDLHDAVNGHIAANQARRNLYPMLRDGFLLWWNDRRRWTNRPFTEAPLVKGVYVNDSLGVTAKIGGVMCVKDGDSEDHYIYPYFPKAPVLSEEAARVGLWVMSQTFPAIDTDQLRILDVMRGDNHSLEISPLKGNEKAIFEERFSFLIREWERLKAEYD